MIRRHIRKIHNKPEHTRQMIALVVTLVLTAAIIAVWVYSLAAHFEEKRTNKDQEEEVRGESPFAVIKGIFEKKKPGLEQIRKDREEAFSDSNEVIDHLQMSEENIETVEDLEAAIDALYGEEI